MPEKIEFCRPVGKYYFLSPLSEFSIKMTVDGTEYTFPTVEHYYQAMKFYAADARFDVILNLQNPDDARLLTKTPEYKVNRRIGFDDMKFSIMEKGLRAKLAQNKSAADLLLTTGNATLIKSCDVCYKCGFGRGGNNRLGRMLMDIRNELQNGK